MPSCGIANRPKNSPETMCCGAVIQRTAPQNCGADEIYLGANAFAEVRRRVGQCGAPRYSVEIALPVSVSSAPVIIWIYFASAGSAWVCANVAGV